MTLRLRRLDPKMDQPDYLTAWAWMDAQPDLYRQNWGFDDFYQFIAPPFQVADFFIEDDDQPLAFASLLEHKPGIHQFCLIAPARPRVRAILRVLAELQRRFFAEMGGWYLFISLQDAPQFDRAARMARMMGWRQIQPRYFEMTLVDQLGKQHVT
jgi:hypothetical protein